MHNRSNIFADLVNEMRSPAEEEQVDMGEAIVKQPDAEQASTQQDSVDIAPASDAALAADEVIEDNAPLKIHSRGVLAPPKHVFIGTGDVNKRFVDYLDKLVQEWLNKPNKEEVEKLTPRHRAFRALLISSLKHTSVEKDIVYQNTGPQPKGKLNIAQCVKTIVVKYQEQLRLVAPYYNVRLTKKSS